MLPILFSALLLAQPPAVQTEEVPAVQTEAVPAGQAPAGQAAAPVNPAPVPAVQPQGQVKQVDALSFFSQRFPFRWDQTIPLTINVDGLRVNSIYFNKRTLTLLKGTDFGTRAVVAVTNTAATTRTPGFAVAVFDAENRLVGVASGGPKIGGVPAGDTQEFSLSFSQVLERIPRGDHFVLTVELTK